MGVLWGSRRLGGIFELSRLTVEHRAELAADFRSIFHVQFDSVQIPELWFLVRALLADPASRFHAAVAGWDHPLAFEGIYLLDQIDVLLMRWSEQGKFKPVPRPWDVKKVGKKRTVSEALRILRPHLADQKPYQREGDDPPDDGSGDS